MVRFKIDYLNWAAEIVKEDPIARGLFLMTLASLAIEAKNEKERRELERLMQKIRRGA